MSETPLKLAIAGLGAIGMEVARAVDQGKVPGIRLVAVSANNQAAATARLATFAAPPVVTSLSKLVEYADVIVECAPAAVFSEVADAAIANGCLFLPLSVTGSHVGPRTCHTSGRVLDISFRAWVAAQRHMGFEMDPRELDAREVAVLSQVTSWWKDNRDWMRRADILRLDSADPAVTAEQQLAADGARFVVFAGKSTTSKQIAPRPLPLTGLDPAAIYRISLKNRAEISTLSRGTTALKDQTLELSGAYLMRHGITLPWSFPERMWVVEGTRL